MKTSGLLLALLLGGATALRAQPTNREYNRLQEATQRAYSVPDRPAPRSAPAERSYTPSNSSGPNTPYSGGMQVVVPTNSNLFGKTYESAEEKQARQERDAQIAAGRAAGIEAKEQAERRQDRINWDYGRREHYEATGLWVTLGYDENDATRLGTLTRTQMGQAQHYPEADLRKFEGASRARQALKTKLSQPDADFEELHKLVAAEWGTLEQGISFGTLTALNDVDKLRHQFPAQAALLTADQLRLNIAVLGTLWADEYEHSRVRLPLSVALRGVTQNLPQQQALISLGLLEVASGAAKNLQTYDVLSDIDRKNVLALTQLLYTTCKTALASTRRGDKMLTDALGISADVLLTAEEHDQRRDPAHLEWLQAASKSSIIRAAVSRSTSELLRAVLDEPTLLLQPDRPEAKELELLVWKGQAVDLPLLARMLTYTNITPDNPDWKSLKKGEPLTKLLDSIGENSGVKSVRYLIQGVIVRCTKPKTYGNGEVLPYDYRYFATELWDYVFLKPNSTNQEAISKAKDDHWQLTTRRNLYRAAMLKEFGGENYWRKIMTPPAAASPSDQYEMALILLDQHPAYAPIGKSGKEQQELARKHLTAAAAAGYEPAQAKLKEL